MSQPSLWDRLRRARLVRILLVYLGVSWVVLQIIETLMGLLELPEWVGPVALILLAIGMFVVLATGWVQSLPQTTAREEAGEVPTDWEVAPADVVRSVMSGKLPHLTWGRAILGGVVALSLLFGAAGLFVLVRGPTSLIGPQEAGADDVASGIAVLPFHVTGPDLEVYREGMVDLVSANLDGLSGYRAVDARTVLARWNREIGETADAELDEALRVAASTGARYAVVGNGVELGSRIRFTADIYDLDTGEEVGTGQVEGSPEEVLALVDALTVDVMRSLLDATGQGSTAQTFRLASLLTESVPALRDYLEGDAAFRRGDFSTARDHLERAVEQDSTFALALWRLGETWGWLEGIGAREGREYKRRAAVHGDRLPAREATLLQVGSAIADNYGSKELGNLRDFIRRYPDDPDGWYLLGEMGLHEWDETGITDAQLEEALYKTVELDPTFGPYYSHATEWAIEKNQPERYRGLMAGYEANAGDRARADRMRLKWEFLRGDPQQRAAAVAELGNLTEQELGQLHNSMWGRLDDGLASSQPQLDAAAGIDERAATQWYARFHIATGQFGALRNRMSADASPEAVVRYAGFLEDAWGLGREGTEVARSAYQKLLEVDDSGPWANDLHAARFRWAARLGETAAARRHLEVSRQYLEENLAGIPWDTTGVHMTIEAAEEAALLASDGRFEEAHRRLRSTLDALPPKTPYRFFFTGDLGELAFQAQVWPEVIRIYEGVSRGDGTRTLAKYRLGVAYEATGDTEKALDAYEAFLLRWEEADPDLELLTEVREAVQRLGG
jgi:tetratricopeptide (TPR) repeat protein